MKYTLNITQELIDFGVKGSCSGCPIARAGLAAGMCYVSVSGCAIRWWTSAYAGRIPCRYMLPEIALQFIRDYDVGKTTQPFSFEEGR